MNAIAHDILKQNDTDLLKPHQLEGFRHYLVSQNCKVRKGNSKGQFLFVETSAGWAALQRGAGGSVKTPIALRAVIHDYLKTPAARSVSLAQCIKQAALVPVEAAVAAAVATPELAPAPAAAAEAGRITGEGSSRAFQILPLGAAPAPAAVARARQMAKDGYVAIIEAPKEIDLQHLQDLRDDFAIHCPLPMHEGEDLATYADRRWAYADVMMTKRFPMDADK